MSSPNGDVPSSGIASASQSPSSETGYATKMTGDHTDMNTLYQAIQTLYSENGQINPADKHKASEFLDRFQRSVEAWTLADQLLYQGPDLNTRYFGAHTLRTKIQSSFHELPQESYSSLRDSLVQHIKNNNGRTETSVMNQLCLAVTYLVLQATSWADPIGQLLSSLGADVNCWWPLLEILVFIPEEAYSRKLHLGENRRHEIMTQLEQVAHAVLSFCKQCLNTFTSGRLTEVNINTETLVISIMNCLRSWVPVSPEIFCTDQQSNILGYAIAQLQSGRCSCAIHEAATECVAAVIVDLPNPEEARNNNQIDLHSLQNALFQSIMACEEAYHLSVAEEDLDKSLNYCRLFTDYAESMIEPMVNSFLHRRTPHYSLRSIDLVLTCLGHHDYEIAEATFLFWFKLSEVVYHKHDVRLNDMFKPYVQRCILALYKHCYIEADHEGPLDKDDDFYDFRKRVQELVEDLEFMVGSLQVFHEIGNQLADPTVSWYQIESALFLLRPLAKSVDMSNVEVIEPVIRAVLSTTDWKHICVRISAVKFIGSMAVWFRKHPGEYLIQAMSFLAKSLEFPEASNPAGSALLNMCQNCAEQVAPNLSSLLGLLEQMDRYNVSNDAVVGLLRGLGHIVGKLPRVELQIVLKQICFAQLMPLNALAEAPQLTGEKNTKEDPCFWVDRLSALFRTTDIDLKDGEEHPCKPVICEDVWPVMSKVCNRFQADPRIMERVCRCLRFAVRCVGKHSHPFVQPLITQLVQMYQAHHHSCFLYIGSILVDEYGSESACTEGLLQMLEAFYIPTFQLLGDIQGLKNHPDTVDDFFRLCVRYIQHCPQAFLGSQVFTNIMQLGIHGINLDHTEANTSVMKFFYELVHQCRKESPTPDGNVVTMVRSILNQYGPNCVYTCLHASIFNLPSSLLLGICDLLYQIKQYLPNETSAWLEAALKQLPNQTVSGAPYATLAQLEAFHKQVMGSRSAKEMSRFLKEFCRLYR